MRSAAFASAGRFAEGVLLSSELTIDRHLPVRIGDFTLFGPGVHIYTPLHPFNAPQRRREEYGKPIEIGSDVWVGGGALILAGVRIGSRAVIGAGSVVTRDIPASVFAGNPCRVIRDIAE